MKEIIKKLIEHKIFKIDTLIEAEITKSFMGSPVKKQALLRVKQITEDYCLADQEGALDYEVPLRKIMYDRIKIVDGMDPQELAAVYGLAPKTARFKKRKEQ
tara:strand:- start:5355 stop:5660 length:306 start_codon:yes stop_codon:yes gene_type:complete